MISLLKAMHQKKMSLQHTEQPTTAMPSSNPNAPHHNVLTIGTYILLNSLIWGVTNPLLKYYGSKSLTNREDDDDNKTIRNTSSHNNNILNQLISLFGNWKFVMVQMINWCGSLFFLMLLGYTNLTTYVSWTSEEIYKFGNIVLWFVSILSLVSLLSSLIFIC